MSIINKGVMGVPPVTLGWRDNIAKFSAAKGRGTREPVWTNMGNGLYNFVFDPLDELFVTFHVDHDYALGTDAYPHIHFVVNSTLTVGQTIVWEFGYVIDKWHSQGQSLIGAETVITLTYTATGSEVLGEHIIVECSDLQAFDLIEPDTLISARVMLVSSQAVGSVFGIMADLHYQSNMMNTINKAPNFYGT